MRLFFPRETDPSENRVMITPEVVAKLVKNGAEIGVESGLGSSLGWGDERYRLAGATLFASRSEGLETAGAIFRFRKPSSADLANIKAGTLHVSFLDPFNDQSGVETLAKAGIRAVSLEMIPRTTLAQKMDVLSSQANLAGYVSVLLAANHLPKILPMMMTAAGTLTPSKVLIVGAGVAGLQAIATARRLGAKVSAYDTRPVVEEQVKSLGAAFVKIDIGETGQTSGGYAKALDENQLARQREALKKVCAESDVVITTAQVFGRKAPVIITKEILSAMKPGSVVVDGAVESGGNVEGAAAGQTTLAGGVTVVALPALPGRVPVHASQVLAGNIQAFIEHSWDKESKSIRLRLDDEIIRGCLLTLDGEICHPDIRSRYGLPALKTT
ncbi:MAG: NAD(P) transhydrogenase subunit alpha [Candidatus Methylacidiphilales bacterium]|nr:NAD(P) transhydrogenase subunit alpha [Candidatus Methylacidiphilales bacterium]